MDELRKFQSEVEKIAKSVNESYFNISISIKNDSVEECFEYGCYVYNLGQHNHSTMQGSLASLKKNIKQ